MLSGTSSCKARPCLTLFHKNLTRFWPLWVGYGGVLLVTLPLPLLSLSAELRSGAAPWAWEGYLEGQVEQLLWNAGEMGVLAAAGFGLLAAMALLSFLMNPRACQMIHALPVKREALFAVQWLSGAAFLLLPQAAVAAVTGVVMASMGVWEPGALLGWLGLSWTVGMCFFSFAGACAMFTGHLVALPVFYGVMNILVLGLAVLGDLAMTLLLVGYSSQELSKLAPVRWCTPVWHLVWQTEQQTAQGWWNAGCYGVVLAAAFTVLALEVYRLRPLERTGDVVTVGWLRPVFRWGVGVCTGMLMGTLLYAQFFPEENSLIFLLLTAAFAVVGSFVAQMFLKKSLHVFADGWKSAAALGAVMLVLLGAARLDLFGFQRWVPDPAQVAQVTIRGPRLWPDDVHQISYTAWEEEEIRAVTDLHAAMTARLDRLEDNGGVRDPDGEAWTTATLRLVYQMKDGRRVTRYYREVVLRQSEVDTPGTYAAQLQALVNRPRVREQLYWDWIEDWQDLTVTTGWLEDEEGNERIALDQDRALALWEAAREDLAAGRLGCWLLYRDPSYQAENMGFRLRFQLTGWVSAGEEMQTETGWSSVTLRRSATAVRKTLAELGIDPETFEPIWEDRAEADADAALAVTEVG